MKGSMRFESSLSLLSPFCLGQNLDIISLRKKQKKESRSSNFVMHCFHKFSIYRPCALLNLLSPNIFAQVLDLCFEHWVPRLRRQPIGKLAGTSVEGDYEMSIMKKRKRPTVFFFFEERSILSYQQWSYTCHAYQVCKYVTWNTCVLMDWNQIQPFL